MTITSKTPGMAPRPVLIFAYGNRSRGDDALAPLLVEQLQQQGIITACGHPLTWLTDYQMQIEHALDLQPCERVLLVDADVALDDAFRFYPVQPRQDTDYTTHGMTPATLLYTYGQVFNQPPPATAMLAIRGVRFELGEGLSALAQGHLQQALDFMLPVISASDFSLWDQALRPR